MSVSTAKARRPSEWITHTLGKVLLDLVDGSGLLKRVTSDIERKVINVDEDLDPVEVSREVILSEISCDEDPSNKELERLQRDVIFRVEIIGYSYEELECQYCAQLCKGSTDKTRRT